MVHLNGSALPDQDFNPTELNGSHALTAAKDPQPRRARSSQTSRGPKPFLPRSLKEALQLAELLSKSKLIPKGFETPETCLVGILYGMEVGLSPIAALQRMAVIDGRPTIWGDAALALVQASGLLQSIQEEVIEEPQRNADAGTVSTPLSSSSFLSAPGSTGSSPSASITYTANLIAICTVRREGRSEPVIGTFSIEDAKRAGLWQKQGPWTDYPKRMLIMRARAFALRDAFPDVLAGLYIREEFEGAEKRQLRSSQEQPTRDEDDWNTIGAEQSKSSHVSRRAPPPPPDSGQESDKQIETEKYRSTPIQETDLAGAKQSSVEVSDADQNERDPEAHLDPETLLDLFDSALCCALDLPTLEEIVDDFAERLKGLSENHQKQAQKIIDRHHRRVEDLDQTELPNLGIGQFRPSNRRKRIRDRLSRPLASWNARQPLISKYVDQSDDEATSLDDQNSETAE